MKTLLRSVSAAIVFSTLVSAQCPANSDSSAPHWSFTDIQWTYYGSLSQAAVSSGALTWNARESFTTVAASTVYNDIGIVDDNTLPENLGETLVSNYGQANSSCYLRTSSSCNNICFNLSRIDYADVKLSPNNIGGAASGWASHWGLSTSDALNLTIKMTTAHEVGHVFGFKNWDPGAQNCSFPTIMSVYDEFYCQLSSGATSCDGATVAANYIGWTLASRSCDSCNVGPQTCSN